MIETDYTGVSEEDLTKLKEEAREARDTLKLMRGLVASPGWKKLLELCETQVGRRECQAMYSSDNELLTLELDRRVLRGEAAGIRTVLSIPPLLIDMYQQMTDEFTEEGISPAIDEDDD